MGRRCEGWQLREVLFLDISSPGHPVSCKQGRFDLVETGELSKHCLSQQSHEEFPTDVAEGFMVNSGQLCSK